MKNFEVERHDRQAEMEIKKLEAETQAKKIEIEKDDRQAELEIRKLEAETQVGKDFDKLVSLLVCDRLKSTLPDGCLRHILSLEASSPGAWLPLDQLTDAINSYDVNHWQDDKGPSIKDVRTKVPFFTPSLPPCPHLSTFGIPLPLPPIGRPQCLFILKKFH